MFSTVVTVVQYELYCTGEKLQYIAPVKIFLGCYIHISFFLILSSGFLCPFLFGLTFLLDYNRLTLCNKTKLTFILMPGSVMFS